MHNSLSMHREPDFCRPAIRSMCSEVQVPVKITKLVNKNMMPTFKYRIDTRVEICQYISVLDDRWYEKRFGAYTNIFFSAQPHPWYMYCTSWRPPSTWVNVLCIRHWICLWRLFGSTTTYRRYRVLAPFYSGKVPIYCYIFLLGMFFTGFSCK